MLLRRLTLAGASFIAAACLTPAQAANATAPSALRPPIEAFFENARYSAALLSPDARFLAVKLGTPNRRDTLVVIDLATMHAKPVAYFQDADIGNFDWVNDQRLVFDTRDKRIGQGDWEYAPGMFAVNRDGSDLLQLVSRSAIDDWNSGGKSKLEKILLPYHTYLLGQSGAQDSDEIYVQSWSFDGPTHAKYVDLLRLNTVTGKSRIIPRPTYARQWLLDQKGEPRLAIGMEKGNETVNYRDPATGKWRQLANYSAYLPGEGSYAPVAFAPNGGLFVSTRMAGDKAALHTLNLETGKIDPQALVVMKDFDFSGHPVTDKDKVLGIHFLADAASSIWFDPKMKAIQADVDAKLPTTVNKLDIGARAATPWVLVRAHSDVQPTVFLLYNTADKTLSKVGDSHPAIVPAQMGRQQFVHYKARDGLAIPAWLTLPAGPVRKDLPMVVLVHGGPYVRGGEWGWDPEAQFLASRGYAVLEPEFRGSTGFGWEHFHAGWKQWGLKMQDDIADGARWAIGQGVANPKRICLAGASYGGYATLMGLLNDPELFKCGIDWVGVTDIKLMYTGHWSFEDDLPDEWKQYGMPELVGDLTADAAQLAATSPLMQAARIKQPLLLAYGGADMRVPAYHGKKFYDAVQPGNSQVEWVEYFEEGHGWALPKNRIDFWTRVEKFLDRNIGKP